MRPGLLAIMLLLGCFPAARCGAQKSADDLSVDEYLQQNTRMQALVNECKAQTSGCDADKTGSDFWVKPNDAPRFEVELNWLRDALRDAKKENDAERAALMAKASARLTGDAAELAGSTERLPAAGDARAQANAILARREFRHVQQASYLQQQQALIAAWLESFFGRMSLPQAPWLVPVIEIGLLMGAAAGLLIWAWQTSKQQRLAVSTGPSERQMLWQKESDDWARRADVEAARGAWRDAVHCLYWAAIVMLEGRRLWRANRARTPREYLPLLEAGSARQRALGGLTRIFERIWYGLRPASRQDFERAHALLQELKGS
jgi:hypothetical protein